MTRCQECNNLGDRPLYHSVCGLCRDKALFRAGAEAVIAYVRRNARAEEFECGDWFSSSTVIDDDLLDVINMKALWAEHKKGHR